ncbi:hypothetical protein FHR32_005674 [Streptosporangium album]|uniref:Uncharacterized protein n=1 Tax=Streptosporangium album TaxID=47479 RepID=A0A7W7S069_9ACTN|nr:hypothetical protein [Streptosporangium album]MBB4941297.1 hypothetical protein [Streptosporangium album]
MLLEMPADDQARRAHGELSLARALVRMGHPRGRPGGGGTPALADKAVVHRVERLLDQRDKRSDWAPAAAYSTAGILLSGPLAVLVAPLLCITVWRV